MKTKAEVRQALQNWYELYHNPNVQKSQTQIDKILTVTKVLEWVLDFGEEGYLKDLYAELNQK